VAAFVGLGTAFSLERLVARLVVLFAAGFARAPLPVPSTLDHEGRDSCLDLFGFFAAADDI
jgi:hypothetical protein